LSLSFGFEWKLIISSSEWVRLMWERKKGKPEKELKPRKFIKNWNKKFYQKEGKNKKMKTFPPFWRSTTWENQHLHFFH
jgi:hypothetical protein